MNPSWSDFDNQCVGLAKYWIYKLSTDIQENTHQHFLSPLDHITHNNLGIKQFTGICKILFKEKKYTFVRQQFGISIGQMVFCVSKMFIGNVVEVE